MKTNRRKFIAGLAAATYGVNVVEAQPVKDTKAKNAQIGKQNTIALKKCASGFQTATLLPKRN